MPCPPTQRVSPHLIVEACHDGPMTVATLGDRELGKWNLDFDRALEIGRENLRERSRKAFTTVRPGLHVSAWQDAYDASRLLLVDLIRELDVEGEPVAFVPDRDYLLVTGSDDDEGLAKASALAAQLLEETSRPMTGVAHTLVGGDWEVFVPNETLPAFQAVRGAAIKSAMIDYQEQKERLEQLLEKRREDVFVASCMAAERPDGTIETLCSWTEGCESLLPRTDLVMFVRKQGGDLEPLGVAAWERVAGAAADLMTKTEDWPERHRVTGFPTPSQFQQMDLRARP